LTVVADLADEILLVLIPLFHYPCHCI